MKALVFLLNIIFKVIIKGEIYGTKFPKLVISVTNRYLYLKQKISITNRYYKHKLDSRSPGKISIILDMQMTPPYGRK